MQLKQLEHDQIICKEVDRTYVPIKTNYHLSPLGQSLVPLIRAMDTWSRDYLQIVANN
ncbi:winged helix-turn-helix transcriptional regulator [Levilactobacillus brevis]|uniref:winged helix-turn-helix transcriptional regulator n=1 Tax=Levilactobacillus brevis TaxID=1580 RepID=UPI000A7129D1|nr:winged helix-turn-helix transcriptional regulator [Levilactobacillus brevis]MCB4357561.1 helix-turn-helix transcriptional regulator [Levilactobacillus brevis]QWK87886.1 winged helix-turn-helix transcriptional regulator [Levilactobacillus brevis]